MAKRTAEQWQALFIEHQESGQSVAEFCRSHGINESYFHTRKKQLQPVIPTVFDGDAFVRADVMPERAADAVSSVIHSRVNLPNGIQLDCAVPLAHFKAWLGALHG
jgi:hypothetical protein